MPLGLGRLIVLTGGKPAGKSGTTNLLRIVWPENEEALESLDSVELLLPKSGAVNWNEGR